MRQSMQTRLVLLLLAVTLASGACASDSSSSEECDYDPDTSAPPCSEV